MSLQLHYIVLLFVPHPPPPGGGEGAIDSGEGEAVHGDETGAAEAARARGC